HQGRPGLLRRIAVAASAGKTPCPAAPAASDTSELVDPAVETTRFADEDVWIAERVGQQRASFIGGDEADREVIGVAPAQRPELLLRPLDGDAHQLRDREAGAGGAFVQLRAEAAIRAPVSRDDLALLHVLADERLQPALW